LWSIITNVCFIQEQVHCCLKLEWPTYSRICFYRVIISSLNETWKQFSKRASLAKCLAKQIVNSSKEKEERSQNKT